MNTVFFDVETQRSFDEVGGRRNIRKLGLAVAVTYSSAGSEFRHYKEADVDALVAELMEADLVVGFNVLSFDYEVLRAYTKSPLGSHWGSMSALPAPKVICRTLLSPRSMT